MPKKIARVYCVSKPKINEVTLCLTIGYIVKKPKNIARV